MGIKVKIVRKEEMSGSDLAENRVRFDGGENQKLNYFNNFGEFN